METHVRRGVLRHVNGHDRRNVRRASRRIGRPPVVLCPARSALTAGGVFGEHDAGVVLVLSLPLCRARGGGLSRTEASDSEMMLAMEWFEDALRSGAGNFSSATDGARLGELAGRSRHQPRRVGHPAVAENQQQVPQTLPVHPRQRCGAHLRRPPLGRRSCQLPGQCCRARRCCRAVRVRGCR